MHRFIRKVGGGAKVARPLERDEAREAMGLIARGACEPVQVGAFLLALRMKGETADELAGFADALEEHAMRFVAPSETLEVDGHGDGHAGVASLLPAAMCAAAAAGVPVCLGVELRSPYARHGLDVGLAAIGLGGALPSERAARDLARAGIAAWDLASGCPPLAGLVALRPLFGRRTVAQTLAKLVSAGGCRRRLVGVFHAPYLESTAAALGLLGVERGLVVQALGGLPEARPGKIVRVAYPQTVRATALDLRDLPSAPAEGEAPVGDEEDAPEGGADAHAAAANRAALDGDPAHAGRAAATAALLVHAATGADPLTAARDAFDDLVSGRARAIASRLG